MKKTRAGRPFRIAALLVGCLFALLADFLVRQAYLAVRPKKVAEPQTHRVRHSLYHHGIAPNSSATDHFGPYSAPYFSNSLGLRDESVREIPLVSSRARILFIGDSFTEAGPIPWGQTFVGRVAAALQAKGVEVLNAGVASYCPTLIKIKLRDLLVTQGLQVDRVVVLIDISDLKDELYYRENSQGAAEQIPYGPFFEQAARLGRIDRICDWLETHVEKNFVILGAVVRNVRLQWRKHGDRGGVTAYDEIPLWAYGWPDYQGPYQNLVTEGLRRAQASMQGVAGLLREQGVALTVVVYPWPQQIRARTQPSRVEKVWAEWSEKNKAQFITLFPIFVNTTPAEEIISQYYWKNDAHWNEEGHRLVAEALLRADGGLFLPAKTSP